MSGITQLLDAASAGDRQAASELLPLVYEELRKLAAARMAEERPGHTLSATALVHEAYVRLVGTADEPRWENRGHFFAAAAESMRRILVDRARQKARLRHGGDRTRVPLPDPADVPTGNPDEIVAVSEALDRLADADAQAADLVKLHYFAGMTFEECARLLNISERKVYQVWAFARTWLFRAMGGDETPDRS